MTPAIDVRDLVKTYPARPPVEAVRGVTLTVPRGECFGLLGPNGAGKTTTMEILEGLAEPTSGTVEVLGLSWKRDAAKIRSMIGISLQETRLTDKLTVRETVTLFRSFYPRGLAPSEAIELVSLGEKQHVRFDKLSGGQRQRLAVACALVGDPELLFLDEPTTGLDPQSRRQLWEVIQNYKSTGRTVLLTTHYMDEAERLCDRVAIIDGGQVIALGTPSELIRTVGGEHVVEFSLQGRVPLPERELSQLPTVLGVTRSGDGYHLTASDPARLLPALLQLTQSHAATLSSLSTRTGTLEDVFVTLTGRHLRDDGPARAA